jgi:starvation-inducible outer membrane lipoprotein
MAEPGVTLTDLITHPEMYHKKVALLGGTIVEEEEAEEYLLLRIRNRPLDQDYVPHRPIDMDGPEGGHYWVMVAKQQLPPQYRQWMRMTVAGRVTGRQRYENEPVLWLLYVRGWGAREEHHGIWKDMDPNYIPSVPGFIPEVPGRYLR